MNIHEESKVQDVDIVPEESNVQENVIKKTKVKKPTTVASPTPILLKQEESDWFVQVVLGSIDKYIEHGARSSQKVDYFHHSIMSALEQVFPIKDGFSIKSEQNIPSCNASGQKKCDIVVYKNNIAYIVFPVKLPMTNYKQNKNNNWENLTGEVQHLKWANPGLHVCPINVFIDKTPYLANTKRITKFENITTSDINIYIKIII